jgi:hypothetical protein
MAPSALPRRPLLIVGGTVGAGRSAPRCPGPLSWVLAGVMRRVALVAAPRLALPHGNPRVCRGPLGRHTPRATRRDQSGDSQLAAVGRDVDGHAAWRSGGGADRAVRRALVAAGRLPHLYRRHGARDPAAGGGRLPATPPPDVATESPPAEPLRPKPLQPNPQPNPSAEGAAGGGPGPGSCGRCLRPAPATAFSQGAVGFVTLFLPFLLWDQPPRHLERARPTAVAAGGQRPGLLPAIGSATAPTGSPPGSSRRLP